MFQKATKQKAKLRMSIAGPSGSGKTYTALAIASNFGKVAVVDTENASASKYADLFDFDVLEMDAPYHPDRFVEAITEAAKAGYDVVIVDSLSPAWNGSGGLLELVDQFAKRMKTSNSFAAWKDATPIQNRLAEAIVRSKIHIIATMRSKTEYVLETVNGKNIPRKVGMAPVQRDGFEYEFDVTGELNYEHDLIIDKTRCTALDGKVFNKAGSDIATILMDWLGSGQEPVASTPPPAPVASEPAQVTTPPANGKPQHPPRPMEPEKTRQFIASLVTYKRSKNADGTQILTDPDAPASQAARGLFVGKLTEVFAPNDDAEKMRRSVIGYLFGVESSTELTKAEVSAGLDWLIDHKTDEGDYIINAFAIDEARVIERQVLLDAGQQEMKL